VVMPDADLAKAYGERLRHALQRRRSMLARGSARWKSRQASALPHSNSPRTRPNSPLSVRTKRLLRQARWTQSRPGRRRAAARPRVRANHFRRNPYAECPGEGVRKLEAAPERLTLRLYTA